MSEDTRGDSSQPQDQLPLFREGSGPGADQDEAAASAISQDAAGPKMPPPEDGEAMVSEWLAQADNDDEADMIFNRVASLIARVAVRVGTQGVRHNGTS